MYADSCISTALRQRDGTCRITGFHKGVQTAHVCPRSEEDWYLRNGMSRYNYRNSDSVDNIANALLLRADLRIAFDIPAFFFIPRPSIYLYHNRETQGLRAIFLLLSSFLKGKTPRRLRLEASNNNRVDIGPLFASAEQCEELLTRSKSRNAQEADTDSSQEGKDQRSRKRRRSCTVQDMAAIDESSVSSNITSASRPTPALIDKLAHLRQEWLHKERQRSNPSGQWEEEIAWGAGVYNGEITLSSTNIARWVEFNGGEHPPHNKTVE
ncbi:hypothetical protein A9K55_005360 [Cordyceps militaris]|uniref:HNH nuclease domain-containing protein n=1 Tax=Cordyceps militaris TaxID=73501 RepID=A0A2H4SPF4_CORMI|nr:hypothetical protein A9K55_005360 [Cordyceps militaris]